MPLVETMGISHPEMPARLACPSTFAREIRALYALFFRLVVDRVVAGMNCERESGVKGSACSL